MTFEELIKSIVEIYTAGGNGKQNLELAIDKEGTAQQKLLALFKTLGCLTLLRQLLNVGVISGMDEKTKQVILVNSPISTNTNTNRETLSEMKAKIIKDYKDFGKVDVRFLCHYQKLKGEAK